MGTGRQGVGLAAGEEPAPSASGGVDETARCPDCENRENRTEREEETRPQEI